MAGVPPELLFVFVQEFVAALKFSESKVTEAGLFAVADEVRLTVPPKQIAALLDAAVTVGELTITAAADEVVLPQAFVATSVYDPESAFVAFALVNVAEVAPLMFDPSFFH